MLKQEARKKNLGVVGIRALGENDPRVLAVRDLTQ